MQYPRLLLHAFRDWHIGKDPSETFVRVVCAAEAEVVAGWANVRRLPVERTADGELVRVEVRRPEESL